MLQRNKQTGKAYFPPRPFDPEDPFAEVEWFQASGKGTLLTYIISHRPPPGFEAPFSIAVVRLEEGVQDGDQHRRLSSDSRSAPARHGCRTCANESERRHHAAHLAAGEGSLIQCPLQEK
jgi:hypothetical protein